MISLSRSTGVWLLFSLAPVVFLSACLSWRPEPTRPADLVARQKPPVIRMTLRDSTQLVLRNPEVQGDTIYGHPPGSRGHAGNRSGIPLSSVARIETQRTDTGKSMVLGFGIALGAFTALCVVGETFGCGDPEAFLEGRVGAK